MILLELLMRGDTGATHFGVNSFIKQGFSPNKTCFLVHLEGWVMLYNPPPFYITGCYTAFMLYNTLDMLYNIPGGVI
jgi:hypothetical protein